MADPQGIRQKRPCHHFIKSCIIENIQNNNYLANRGNPNFAQHLNPLYEPHQLCPALPLQSPPHLRLLCFEIFYEMGRLHGELFTFCDGLR
jgi:hypothetical protein